MQSRVRSWGQAGPESSMSEGPLLMDGGETTEPKSEPSPNSDSLFPDRLICDILPIQTVPI